MKWLVRVEGVNFTATIDDTNDLSTIRGGSLALLEFHTQVRQALASVARSPSAVAKVFSGASLCAFEVDSDADDFPAKAETAIQQEFAKPQYGCTAKPNEQKVPLHYLTVVVDTVEATATAGERTVDDDIYRAEAANHASQFRQWTISPLVKREIPLEAEIEADRYEKSRPAEVEIRVPSEHALNSSDADVLTDKTDKYHVSKSVAARRNFGVNARQAFYASRLTGETWGEDDQKFKFTNSVTELVARPPLDLNLPISLKSKIAVVYADGNKFNTIRQKVVIAKFSEDLEQLRIGLLKEIIGWYRPHLKSGEDTAFGAQIRAHDHELGGMAFDARRFETLLWGGDELIFVMPAWLAVAFVELFFKVTTQESWKIGGSNVTHAVSVVIAHHKTPIRQLKTIAKRSADLAKEASPEMRKVNSVTFEIYESLAPPDTDENFAQERFRLYGHNAVFGDNEGKALAQFLALPGTDFDQVIQKMKGWRGKFPRSQIYAALRKMRGVDQLWTEAADIKAAAWLEDYDRRVPMARDFVADHQFPFFAYEGQPRPLSLQLAMIATLWDYFQPVESDALRYKGPTHDPLCSFGL